MLSFVILGVAFLAGCGQQQTTQTQPTTPTPVAQQPTPPATNQSVASQPNDNQAKNEVVYTNNEYEFKITLPEAYKDYKVEQLTGDDAYAVKKWQISIKTTAKDYAANGYYEPSFTIDLIDIKKWDSTADCKNVDWREKPCINKEFLLGKSDKYVFSYTPSQDRSPAGLKVIEEFLLSGKIKQNFQLF